MDPLPSLLPTTRALLGLDSSHGLPPPRPCLAGAVPASGHTEGAHPAYMRCPSPTPQGGLPADEALGRVPDEAYQPSPPSIRNPGVTALEPPPPQLQTVRAPLGHGSSHGLPPPWPCLAGTVPASGHTEGSHPAYMSCPTPTPWPGVTALATLPCSPAAMGNPISSCTWSPEASAPSSPPQQCLRRVEVIRPTFPHPAAKRARR